MIPANHSNCKYFVKLLEHGKCTKTNGIFHNIFDFTGRLNPNWKTAVCDEWEGEENERKN